MDKYYIDGEEYIFKNGKWLTSSFMIPPLAIVNKLNKMMQSSGNIEKMRMDELLEVVDNSRERENYRLAEQALERAMTIAKEDEIKIILPRLTSNYRKQGKPQEAIDVSEKYLSQYGTMLYSPMLFTSIAAAYCDLGDFVNARLNANRARSLSGSQSSVELISVYSRINKEEA